jgi:LysR family transcriptional regulator, glycine cleavage system transcriptional activator
VGIGPFALLDVDVLAGRLVAPFPDIKVRRAGYVALVPFDADKSAPLKASSIG